MRSGREPQRTCAGCGTHDAKAAMVRVVRRPSGAIEVDPTGRASGRGAYVHRSPACIETALGRGRLAKVLRASVGTDTAGRLRRFSEESG